MTPLKKQILAGTFGYLAVFLTQLVAYMNGLVQAGQTWSDAEPMQLAQFALTAMAGALGALQALLTDNTTPLPPPPRTPRLKNPDAPDVTL